jgi:hypothetical protein
VTGTVEISTEKSLKETLVQRFKSIAVDGNITRKELRALVDDMTVGFLQLLEAISQDGTISDDDIGRLAEAIAEGQQS